MKIIVSKKTKKFLILNTQTVNCSSGEYHASLILFYGMVIVIHDAIIYPNG